jgi:outer membrane biogenesis lipoprotein LolB
MTHRRHPLSSFLVACSLVVLAGCAGRRFALPTDSGAPLPDFAQVHQQVSAACRGVRTMTAELALSGKAGAESLRGRVVSGFEQPASMRLEGVAPFGPPAFILVSRNGDATLVLPRDQRVVRNAKPDEILGALTGVTLGPADLAAILSGCVTAAPKPTAGRVHRNGWASIDLEGGATVYLQRDGASWRVRAARRGDWEIEYPVWQGSFPASVRLRSDMPARVDLSAAISQLEVNVDIDAAAFSVSVPAGADPMSIQELRENGPLRDRQQ